MPHLRDLTTLNPSQVIGPQAKTPVVKAGHSDVAPLALNGDSGLERGSELQLSQVLGINVGALAGTSAVKVYQFLNDPVRFITLRHPGGFQGMVSAGTGALAASLVPDKVVGTVVGAVAGGGVGFLQAAAVKPQMSYMLSRAALGMVLGGVAGNVTEVLRERAAQRHQGATPLREGLIENSAQLGSQDSGASTKTTPEPEVEPQAP